jgi:dihydroorotate dehydrogenase (NAD+) catalytic subunit
MGKQPRVQKKQPNLSVKLGRIKLKNPVMVASGTFGVGEEMARVFSIDQIGAIVTKSVTSRQRSGNRTPRIYETPSGMLNSIGLENVGIDRFLKEKLPFIRRLKTQVIINIAGHKLNDFVAVAKKLDRAGVHAIELNLSCPNVGHEGLEWSQDPEKTAQVVHAVKAKVRAFCIAKLSPNVTDVGEIACAAEQGGADAVSLINSPLGMAVDVQRRTPRIASVVGGLTGPAIRAIAVRCVWEVGRRVKIPVIGIGGITSSEDALEFLIAGASAVQIGSANFVDPMVSLKVIKGLEIYLKSNQISHLKDLVGTLKV